MTGMVRDVFTRHTWRPFTAPLIVISVHAVGLTALTSAGIITPEHPPFAPIAVVVGAFIFGVGIVPAGGCVSGTWYRAGEGPVGSWLAPCRYALSAATGRNDGLGITMPSQNVANYTATGDGSFLDRGAPLVLGTLVGALIAAKVSAGSASACPTRGPRHVPWSAAPSATAWSRPLCSPVGGGARSRSSPSASASPRRSG